MPLAHLILNLIILVGIIFIIIRQRKSRKLDKEINEMLKQFYGEK